MGGERGRMGGGSQESLSFPVSCVQFVPREAHFLANGLLERTHTHPSESCAPYDLERGTAVLLQGLQFMGAWEWKCNKTRNKTEEELSES